jgi:hypothetical protein
MKTFTVFYAKSNYETKPETEVPSRVFGSGIEFARDHAPKVVAQLEADIYSTHVPIVEIHIDDSDLVDPLHILDRVYSAMQGERWSVGANHKWAQRLIRSLPDIHHTSMSVGDIIVDNDTLEVHMVDRSSFSTISAVGIKTHPYTDHTGRTISNTITRHNDLEVPELAKLDGKQWLSFEGLDKLIRHNEKVATVEARLEVLNNILANSDALRGWSKEFQSRQDDRDDLQEKLDRLTDINPFTWERNPWNISSRYNKEAV